MRRLFNFKTEKEKGKEKTKEIAKEIRHREADRWREDMWTNGKK